MKAVLIRPEIEKRRPCTCRVLLFGNRSRHASFLRPGGGGEPVYSDRDAPTPWATPSRLSLALSRLSLAAGTLINGNRTRAARLEEKKHFIAPQNMGSLEDADIMILFGDRECGGKLFLSLKISGGRIRKIRYRVLGCSVAVATVSVASEMAQGKTLEEVMSVTEDRIATALGGLPEEKRHCLPLAVHALRTAVGHYQRKYGVV